MFLSALRRPPETKEQQQQQASRSAPPSDSFVVQCFLGPGVPLEPQAAELGRLRLVRLNAQSTVEHLLHQLRVNGPPSVITACPAKGDGSVMGCMKPFDGAKPLWGQIGFVFPFLVRIEAIDDDDRVVEQAPPSHRSEGHSVEGDGTARGAGDDPVASQPVQAGEWSVALSPSFGDASVDSDAPRSPNAAAAARRRIRLKREEERRRREQLNAKRLEAIATIEARRRELSAAQRAHAAEREIQRQRLLEEDRKLRAVREEQRVMHHEAVLEQKRRQMACRLACIAEVQSDFQARSDELRRRRGATASDSVVSDAPVNPSAAAGLQEHHHSGLDDILSDLHRKMALDAQDATALQKQNVADARLSDDRAYLNQLAHQMRDRTTAASRQLRAKAAAASGKISDAEAALGSVLFLPVDQKNQGRHTK